MKRSAVFLCLITFLLLQPVLALELQQIFIDIDRQGNAAITISYQSNPVEYAGVKVAAASSDMIVNQKLSAAFRKPTRLACTQPGTIGLNIEKFATISGNTYKTSEVRLDSAVSQDLAAMAGPLNPRSDVVILFPDGYFKSYPDTLVIPEVSHTLAGTASSPGIAPQVECRKKDPLPLSGIIPDEAEPVAAVATGIAVTGVALGSATMGPSVAQFLDKLATLVKKYLGQRGVRILADRAQGHPSLPEAPRSSSFGRILNNELVIVILGILILSAAFLIAKRKPFEPAMILIFIVMVGFALAIHEITHAVFSLKYGYLSSFSFWGLGSLFLFVGGWLFGTTFSQPYVTAFPKSNAANLKIHAIIKISGPLVSLLIAMACFFMIPLSAGLASTAFTIGFSVNLLVCVYSLMPFNPLDGMDVYLWNRYIWAVMFIPLLIFYMVINI